MKQFHRFMVVVAFLVVCSITVNSMACRWCGCGENTSDHVHKHVTGSAAKRSAEKHDGDKCEHCPHHKPTDSDCANCKKLFDEPVVTTKGLEVLMQSGVSMVVLDARPANSYATAHIPGAVNIPKKTSDSDLKKAVREKKLIVVYCGGIKCPLSRSLAVKLHNLGYHNVIEYPFGMQSWTAAGNDRDGSDGKHNGSSSATKEGADNE